MQARSPVAPRPWDAARPAIRRPSIQTAGLLCNRSRLTRRERAGPARRHSLFAPRVISCQEAANERCSSTARSPPGRARPRDCRIRLADRHVRGPRRPPKAPSHAPHAAGVRDGSPGRLRCDRRVLRRFEQHPAQATVPAVRDRRRHHQPHARGRCHGAWRARSRCLAAALLRRVRQGRAGHLLYHQQYGRRQLRRRPPFHDRPVGRHAQEQRGL